MTDHETAHPWDIVRNLPPLVHFLRTLAGDDAAEDLLAAYDQAIAVYWGRRDPGDDLR